jgi:hypothetical protein
MTIPSRFARQDSSANQADVRWSRSERATARKAFDHALNQELQEVIQRAKQMAAAIKQPSELWELEHYLAQRREEVDDKYEYRDSKLTFVFGTLLRDGRLNEEDLRGLREDKLQAIRSYAEFLNRRDEPT